MHTDRQRAGWSRRAEAGGRGRVPCLFCVGPLVKGVCSHAAELVVSDHPSSSRGEGRRLKVGQAVQLYLTGRLLSASRPPPSFRTQLCPTQRHMVLRTRPALLVAALVAALLAGAPGAVCCGLARPKVLVGVSEHVG